MSAWIVTAFESHGITDAVIVEASDSEEAALLGAEGLQEDWGQKSEETVRHVFVAPFDIGTRIAYRTGLAVSRAPLQCCGGPAGLDYLDCDGHYATCDERPEGTGQPREEAAA